MKAFMLDRTVSNAATAHEGLNLRPVTWEDLEDLERIEKETYPFPWTRQHFEDSLRSGYPVQALVKDGEIRAYFVAMVSLDEVHLLNITAHPLHQKKGYGKFKKE